VVREGQAGQEGRKEVITDSASPGWYLVACGTELRAGENQGRHICSYYYKDGHVEIEYDSATYQLAKKEAQEYLEGVKTQHGG
jgi:hypothetical protein